MGGCHSCEWKHLSDAQVKTFCSICQSLKNFDVEQHQQTMVINEIKTIDNNHDRLILIFAIFMAFVAGIAVGYIMKCVSTNWKEYTRKF
uniref:Uncharacterized protein n=1 Tax=Acrobeloides nanus TaxID=290746 RepID=A0A914D9S2_9BILA